MYLTSNLGTQCLFTGHNDTVSVGGQSMAITVTSTTNTSFVVNGVQTYLTTPLIPIDTWTHVAVVRNDITIKYYVNGSEFSSITVAAGATIGRGHTLPPCVGSRANNSWGMQGYVNDFRFTKGLALYTVAFTPPTQFSQP